MRRLKSETCVSKGAPCVRWYSQVYCNVVALQGQMKINVLPLPISVASTVLNVRPPLAQGQLQEGAVLALLDSSGSPQK